MKIYGSIMEIMKEIGAIGKEKRNAQQGYQYRGVDDVMNVLQPLFNKHKVFVTPTVIEHLREERVSKNGVNLIYSILTINYKFFADDGSYVETVVIGEGMDSGDKASNKAMSVAFKYACFQVFCIPTFVGKYFTKGRLAAVSGRLQIRGWTDRDGNKRKNAEVVADSIYFAESKKERGANGYGGAQFTELCGDDELPF